MHYSALIARQKFAIVTAHEALNFIGHLDY